MLHATLYKKKRSLRVPFTQTFLLTTRVIPSCSSYSNFPADNLCDPFVFQLLKLSCWQLVWSLRVPVTQTFLLTTRVIPSCSSYSNFPADNSCDPFVFQLLELSCWQLVWSLRVPLTRTFLLTTRVIPSCSSYSNLPADNSCGVLRLSCVPVCGHYHTNCHYTLLLTVQSCFLIHLYIQVFNLKVDCMDHILI